MKKIVFATNNPHKLLEIRSMLKGKYEIVSLADIGCFEDIPETMPTLFGNALQKAEYILDKYGVDCFADDTGLEVEALNGEPGVYSARYAGEDKDATANMKKLLGALSGKSNRKAQFRTVIALLLNGEQHIFEGIVEGEIAETIKGEKGFGYDPIFIPEGYNQTFAELGADEKNKISHRGRAVKKLLTFLKKKEA